MAAQPSDRSAKAKALAQLDAAIARGKNMNVLSGYSNEVSAVETLCMAAIRAVAPSGSAYRERAERIWAEHGGAGVNDRVPGELTARFSTVTQILYGIVEALRQDVEGGYMDEVSASVDAQTFGSLLEFAEQLLDLGPKYKDPAAVIVGVVLEEHLRKLAGRHHISVADSEQKRLKADALNADLYKAKAYGPLDHKGVTQWLQLRNDAAHADWDKFTFEQVRNTLQNVRDFIARLPA